MGSRLFVRRAAGRCRSADLQSAFDSPASRPAALEEPGGTGSTNVQSGLQIRVPVTMDSSLFLSTNAVKEAEGIAGQQRLLWVARGHGLLVRDGFRIINAAAVLAGLPPEMKTRALDGPAIEPVQWRQG